ncbi:MAG: type III-B CRISPR module-associated protein Cmr3 [Firmicutes bacterium]|jgi:CRISPR-associated protein Cmr3|nr:type III-B CRISPR module-associated protein Cmr3 [Bacillota bacterium]
MTANEMLLVFGCEESYFFRGGQPFNAGEYGYLPSIFPPNCQVMQGAIRTALLKGHGVNFKDYNDNNYCAVCGGNIDVCPVLKAVGSSGSYHDIGMDLKGPCVVHQCENSIQRLYPAPLDLVRLESESSAEKYFRLKPSSEPLVTDRGPIYLPVGESRYKSLEDAWITEDGLLSYLKGEEIQAKDIYWSKGDLRQDSNVFLTREKRIGIARDCVKRSAKEHMLYATEHVRFISRYGLGVRVENLPDVTLPSTIKLGGEGRISSLQTYETMPISQAGINDAIKRGPGIFSERGFKLTLLTPARFSSGWLPDGFKSIEVQGAIVWQGKLEDIDCTLVTACMDRPLYIGGWDIANRRPKPRQAYVPAGSTYYFTTAEKIEEVIAAMHDKKIGLETKIGCGHVVVGRW